MPIRRIHKLRFLPSTGQEFVLCLGRPDKLQIVRYGWQDVDCPDCIDLRHKKVKPKK